MKAMNGGKPGYKVLKVLRVDSSARHEGSVSRKVADALIERLERNEGPVDLMVRDLAIESPHFVDAAWVDSNFTAPERRSEAQSAVLAESDALVAELRAADVLIIGVPIYNFAIPAKLKAWVDMVARARVTFRYTENGPEGLLRGKRAYLAVASGGTAVGSEIDFATGYLRHILGFLGIDDVEIVAADRLTPRGEGRALGDALHRIDRLLPAVQPLAATA
ncbi:MAG: NAD(P)H-dependent oxidoreductase [Chromatiaceae bacterium]